MTVAVGFLSFLAGLGLGYVVGQIRPLPPIQERRPLAQRPIRPFTRGGKLKPKINDDARAWAKENNLD